MRFKISKLVLLRIGRGHAGTLVSGTRGLEVIGDAGRSRLGERLGLLGGAFGGDT